MVDVHSPGDSEAEGFQYLLTTKIRRRSTAPQQMQVEIKHQWPGVELRPTSVAAMHDKGQPRCAQFPLVGELGQNMTDENC